MCFSLGPRRSDWGPVALLLASCAPLLNSHSSIETRGGVTMHLGDYFAESVSMCCISLQGPWIELAWCCEAHSTIPEWRRRNCRMSCFR